MPNSFESLFFILEVIIFTSIVAINLVKKNSHMVISYILQSLAVTAMIGFEPKQVHEVKFRASIIEQHKEIESKIIFARYSV